MKKLLALLLLLLPLTSYALDYKILAVVNGESISNVQVRERVDFLLTTSGAENNVSNRSKATREVTEALIDEALQKQEAKDKGIKVSKSEINVVFADLEKRNNLKPGGFKDFVAKKGISFSAIRDQVVASLFWKKILGTYIRPEISVTEDDIKKAKAQSDAKPAISARKFVNISEIIIPVEFGKEKEARDMAETITRTARSGAEDFGDLAKRYSAGKTAAHKGRVGWLPEDGMIKPLLSKVKNTPTGKITDPISTQSMFVILKINDRKTDAPPQEKLSPENRALISKMEEGAKRYMKVLRDKAYIEKKYKEDDLNNAVWG